jgi:putative membrane protein
VPGFFARLLINMLGLLPVRELVSGVEIARLGTFIAAALLLGLVNALVRPVAILLSLPLTIVTLGLFLFVINGAMLALVAWVRDDFRITSWGAALFGALIVSLTSWVSSRYVGPREEIEFFLIEDQRGQ